MKNLIYTCLFMIIISVFFPAAQSANTENSTLVQHEVWIQSLLREQNNPIKVKDYIFYCTGHHGIIWSLIAYDSTGISLYNGTTRTHIADIHEAFTDSLSFINDNIKTITWGLDSSIYLAHLLTPRQNTVYNPIYNQICVIKNDSIKFMYTDIWDSYAGSDSAYFHKNLSSLIYLMFWLATPSGRPYMPTPSDSLLL